MSEKNSEGSNKLPIPPDKMLSSESAPSDEKNSAQVISQENKPHEEPLEQNENQKMSESPTLKRKRKRKRIDDAEATSVYQETEESEITKSSLPPSKKPKPEPTQHHEPNDNQNSELSYTPIVWNALSSQWGQSTTTTTQSSSTASNSSGTSRTTSSSYESPSFIPPSAAEEAVIRHNQSRTVKPSQRPPTNTLHIVGFVRPFTLAQVKTLLSQHGTITSFWMSDIKNQCYVSYETVEQAEKTREAVYGLVWPVQVKGKPLIAEYVTEEEADIATGNKFRPRSEVVATPSATTSEVHAMSSTSQKENNLIDVAEPCPFLVDAKTNMKISNSSSDHFRQKKNEISKKPEFFFKETSILLTVADMNSFIKKIGIDVTNVFVDLPWDKVPERGWLLCSNYMEDLHYHQDSVYYGSALIGEQLTYVWSKHSLETNPKIVVEPIHYKNKMLYVVRDDMLPGGTKQRGHNFLSNVSESEVVYAGPWNGFAQVALSIACKLHKKKATVFTTRNDYKTNIRARMYGCNIHVIQNATLKQLQEYAAQYASSHKACLMKFGFDSDEFRLELTARLKEALEGHNILTPDFDRTIWLAAGSGTLLKVLYKLFPKAKFGVVQIGKKIWDDQIEPKRTNLFVAPEKFYQEAEFLPPYPNAPTYDAKVWRFVSMFGSSEDIIWNVAGHDV